MAPLRMTPRREDRHNPSTRETHVLTIGGDIAASDGIKFFEIENVVVVSRGINGVTPSPSA